MRQVVITGSGLISALGASVELCTQAMFAEHNPVQSLTMDWFDEPMNLQWYGIDCSIDIVMEHRFYQLFESAVTEAMAKASLSERQTSRMGLFIGSSSYDVGPSEIRYKRDLAGANRATALPVQMVSLGNVLGHLRRKLDLRGPDYTFGTACSASANAVLSATRMLEMGVIDHALVIGLELHNITTLSGFHSLQLLSDDQIRPFDAERSGMILGESCGAVVLSAKDNTGAPCTTIKGGASRCDTSSITGTDPNGSNIAIVIEDALADASVSADCISAIKAHATASQANDQAEAAGLLNVFAELPPICAFKPYIGHTLGACGVVELVLMDACLKQGRLPKTLGYDNYDPALGLKPISAICDLPSSGTYVLNYFGFGGNNTVLVVAHE